MCVKFDSININALSFALIYTASCFHANAANTVTTTGTVSAKVVQSLTVTAIESLRFGQIIAPSSSGSESPPNVTISITDQSSGTFIVTYSANSAPDSSLPNTGAGTLPANGNRTDIGPASVSVSGEPNFFYSTSLSSAGSATITSGADGTSFALTNITGSQQLNATGTDMLFYGGTMSISGATPVGHKTAEVELTVIYD